MTNPFHVGSCVETYAFINRRREIRRLAGSIIGNGQSAAVVGEPRSGKTSLLRYLMAQENRTDLFEDRAEGLFFQFLDGQALGSHFDASRFWELALSPLETTLKQEPELQAAYRTCRLEGFGTFVLERLFTQLHARGWRLALLVDEFDTILHHPVLNQSEFYGGLRSLASRFDSLTLVIAARQALADLNRATQEFSRAGSPYFNFMQEISLGAFTPKDAQLLLARGDAYFKKNDKEYLLRVAGGHPFLLQAAASALWSVYEDGEKDVQTRFVQAGKDLFQQAKPTLEDTWRLWPPEMKKAFTIIALDNVPRLLGERQFDLNALLKSLPDYAPELRLLETRGYTLPDPQLPGGIGIQAEVMLWWLAEELVQALRRKDDLAAWLQAEEWDGLLKQREKDLLVKAAKSAGQLLRTGAEVFIKAAAEGLGKAVK